MIPIQTMAGPTNLLPSSNDLIACTRLQEQCDDVLKTADELQEVLQKNNTLLKTENERLQGDIHDLTMDVYTLQNPSWYQRPDAAFMLGIIGGLATGFLISGKGK